MRIVRRTSLLVLLAATACVEITGCHRAADDPAESPADQQARFAAKLLADTGVEWQVYVDPRIGEVRLLAPRVPVALQGGSVEAQARSFFDRYGAYLGKTDQETIRVTDARTDTYGHRSVRFEHVLAGTAVPIFDSSSLAEVTSDGALIHIEPGFRRDLARVARSATVNVSAAEQTAYARVSATCAIGPGDQILKKGSTLGVLAEPGGVAALAWAVDLRTSSATCVSPRVFVDATTGAILSLRETAAFVDDQAGGVLNRMRGVAGDLKTIDVSERFDHLVPAWTMISSRPAPRVLTYPYALFQLLNEPFDTLALGSWDEGSVFHGAAVDAHYYAGKAVDYFKAVHHRNGIDDQGSDVTVIVHDPEARSKGKNANYWDAGIIFSDDQLHIGDGGDGWLPLSAGFDVLAHEVAHGVTAHSSRLVYQQESGALNESFSDVMAASAENWLPETRDEASNVLIGERVTLDGFGLRSMVDPSEVLPSGVSRGGVDFYPPPACSPPSAANDNCGVHSNSGIGNRAFTLMVLSGIHKKSNVGVAAGMGWEKGRDLWYNTITKLSPLANFEAAAHLQVSVARTQGPDVLGATVCAWFAVGVLGEGDLAFDHLECLGHGTTTSGSSADPACHGSASAYVCSDGTPGYATPCNGSAVTVSCADPTQTCKRASTSDATATIDSNGALECE